jgi:uncharacterized protein (TIGR02217 family)
MSNELLPGFVRNWDERHAETATTLHESATGREFAFSNWSVPRRHFVINVAFLRSLSQQNQQELEGFFLRHYGRAETFLFDSNGSGVSGDADNTVTDQVFGIPDGVTKRFQLLRTRGGFAEPINVVNGVPVIKRGAVVQSGYTIDTLAGVVFAVAPPAGLPLSWSGNYYWRVRFAEDVMPFRRIAKGLWASDPLRFYTPPGAA